MTRFDGKNKDFRVRLTLDFIPDSSNSQSRTLGQITLSHQAHISLFAKWGLKIATLKNNHKLYRWSMKHAWHTMTSQLMAFLHIKEDELSQITRELVVVPRFKASSPAWSLFPSPLTVFTSILFSRHHACCWWWKLSHKTLWKCSSVNMPSSSFHLGSISQVDSYSWLSARMMSTIPWQEGTGPGLGGWASPQPTAVKLNWSQRTHTSQATSSSKLRTWHEYVIPGFTVII